jgi:hypothetical protein
MTTCLNISHWGSKSILPVQCNSFGASVIFPRLVTAWYFPVSVTKKCPERTMICEHQGSHCQSENSTDRGINKLFSRMLPKFLKSLAKFLIAQETKWCLNRCKVTYFCVINQSWELFKASCIYFRITGFVDIALLVYIFISLQWTGDCMEPTIISMCEKSQLPCYESNIYHPELMNYKQSMDITLWKGHESKFSEKLPCSSKSTIYGNDPRTAILF